MMMNRLGFILILVTTFLPLQINGQSEFEIKTTGKYIYSWAIEDDKSKAMENARLGLLDTIFVSLLKESAIDKTDTIFIKVIDYFEQKVGFKWQVIAFAEKSAVKIKLEDLKQLKVIPVIIGDQTHSQEKNNATQHSNDNINMPEKPDPNYKIKESDVRNIKTGNLVLDDLVTLPDVRTLEQKLRKLKADLILNYVTKSNYPDDSGCYIFVIDRNTTKVIAVYDKGKTSRRNFITNTTDNNFADKYKGNNFFYVVIN
jgi:hypothetical protein